MGIQVITSRSESVPNTGATNYAHFGGSSSHNSSEAIAGEQIWSASGTLRNLVVRIGTAPGSGKSWTYTVRINGVDTALVATIADSETTGRNTSDSVSVSAGDRVSLKIVPSGTPTSSGGTNDRVSIEFEGDNAGESVYGRARTTTNSSATAYYIAPFGGGQYGEEMFTEAHAADIIPTPGAITRFDFGVAGTTAGSVVGFLVKNGVAQDGSGGTVDTRVTITATVPRVNSSASFSLPVVAGDRVSIGVTKVAADWPFTWVGICFTADEDGKSIVAGGGGTPGTSAVQYVRTGAGAGGTFSGTEANVDTDGGVTAFTLSDFRAVVVSAPGSGKSYTFSLRQNGATPSGTPAITIADSNTNGEDLTNALTIEDGDTFTLQSSPSGTPTASLTRWSFTMDVSNPIIGSVVVGKDGRVTSSRTFLANLDGVTRTVNMPGSHVVGGNLALIEQASAPTGVANVAKLYAIDNGSGKTRLMVVFGSGAAIELAIEP